MGWQDAPVVGGTKQGGAAWEQAPVVGGASPEPPTWDVVKNAVPKGIANLINAPVALTNLAVKGIASLPGAGHFPALQEAANDPIPNYPMQAAEKLGFVDPAMNPQTGMQRVIDTAVQAGVGAAAGPGGIVRNLATGATSGAVAQTTKEVTGNDLLAVATGLGTPAAMSKLSQPARSAGTATRDETLREAQAAGYVVQPSTVQPSFKNNKLESVAGKAAVAQDASVRNQATTNKLAAQSIGLPEDAPLTMSTLQQVRDKASKAYEDVEALMNQSRQSMAWFPRYHEKNLVEQLKQARADANALYRHYDRNADPATLKQAQAAEKLADSIDGDMEMIAQALGHPELIDQLKAARQLYARTFDVERALNLGDGNVSAQVIGRLLDQGRPLSGELKIVGKFAQAFPRVSRDAAGVPPAGVSGTDPMAAAFLGTGGYAAAGPLGIAAAGLPLLRAPARNLVLSPGYQSKLLPGPATSLPLGPLGRATSAVIDSAMQPAPYGAAQ
jgi:hypothetical protein